MNRANEGIITVNIPGFYGTMISNSSSPEVSSVLLPFKSIGNSVLTLQSMPKNLIRTPSNFLTSKTDSGFEQLFPMTLEETSGNYQTRFDTGSKTVPTNQQAGFLYPWNSLKSILQNNTRTTDLASRINTTNLFWNLPSLKQRNNTFNTPSINPKLGIQQSSGLGNIRFTVPTIKPLPSPILNPQERNPFQQVNSLPLSPATQTIMQPDDSLWQSFQETYQPNIMNNQGPYQTQFVLSNPPNNQLQPLQDPHQTQFLSINQPNVQYPNTQYNHQTQFTSSGSHSSGHTPVVQTVNQHQILPGIQYGNQIQANNQQNNLLPEIIDARDTLDPSYFSRYSKR
jgi:hypothetical protein